MLELLNNLVQNLNAKELELSKELEKEDNEAIEEKAYIVEYFEGNEVATKYIIAKNNTVAWIEALKEGLEIKNIYLLKGDKKELITSNMLDLELINTFIENTENNYNIVVINENIPTNILTRCMNKFEGLGLKIKLVTFTNNHINIIFLDNEKKYNHFRNTNKYKKYFL